MWLQETLNTSTKGRRRFTGPTKALDKMGRVSEGPRRPGSIPNVSLTTEGERERGVSVSDPPCIPLRKMELTQRMLKKSEAHLALRLGSSQATTKAYSEVSSIVRCGG